MYSKKRTLAEKLIYPTNKRIDLPRDSVIDKIFVMWTGTIKNVNATTDSALKLADILNGITDVRIVSDGNTVHYSVRALDLAIMNYYDTQGVAINPDAAFTAAHAASTPFSFMLTFDQGDILALTKESLEMSFNIAPQISTDCTIDTITGTLTLMENVYTTAEFAATYGANLEAAAEPKIVALEKAYNATAELSEFLDLPTGTLSRRAFLITSDASGVRGNADPDKIGIIVTTPDRREIYTVDFATMAKINQNDYTLPATLAGVRLIDYGNEITNDVFGLRGWKYTKGDYQIAARGSNAGKMRYLSCEYVVNTSTFDTIRAVMEGTPDRY
jgi:hypothetical protein